MMVRYERLEFDDNGPSSSRDSVRARATNVRLRAMNALTLGASWKPQPWLRFMGNAGMERFPESRSAPQSGKMGTYFTLGARIRVEIP